MAASDDPKRRATRLVVWLGITALFADLTYEGARSISGPYLALLGASAATMGFVVGLGELVGYGARIVTGWIADRTRSHWPMVAAGYAVNLVAVPALALTTTWEAAAALVVLERLGKAIRSPAKGAVLSGAGEHVGQGMAFGLEEALDQIGAVGGPLVVAAAVATRPDDAVSGYQRGFAILLVPALLTLGMLGLARRSAMAETETKAAAGAELGPRFWATLGAVSLLGLGFADWAIVALHATRAGTLSAASLPLAYAAAMGIDGAAALGFGVLFDRIGLRALAIAAVVSAAAPLLVFRDDLGSTIAGGVLWAIALGAIESIAKAAIGKSAPASAKARAYGLFFGVFGAAWWLGSWALGALADLSFEWVGRVSAGVQIAGAVWLIALATRAPKPAA